MKPIRVSDAPPIVTHAPDGLNDVDPPHAPRRLHSLIVVIGVMGVAAVGLVALMEKHTAPDCKNAEAAGANSNNRQSASHGGGGGAHASAKATVYGGFGATGESGAHSGGTSGEGGGHGGGE